MSQANHNDNGEIPAFRKARVNLYTAMLLVALIALVVGCICLYAEMDAYQFKLSGVYRNLPAALAVDSADAAIACASWSPNA